jgi:hypothetical protein
MDGFVKTPPLAFPGWRLRIPGGPEGGQYHGFVGPDSLGWRGLPGGPPPAPQPSPWQDVWGGTALKEGETHSDYVYRAPGEIRPRPNASGGANTVRSFQTEKSAGYAVAPGNYRGLGGPPLTVCPEIACESVIGYGPAPCYSPVCGPINVVRQPPPPLTPKPSPTVCNPNQYRDAAGYCTSDWHNPYSLYLPAQPSPIVAAGPENFVASQGQPLPSVPASAAASWFSDSTIIPGVENLWIAAGAGLLAYFAMRGKK